MTMFDKLDYIEHRKDTKSFFLKFENDNLRKKLNKAIHMIELYETVLKPQEYPKKRIHTAAQQRLQSEESHTEMEDALQEAMYVIHVFNDELHLIENKELIK